MPDNSSGTLSLPHIQFERKIIEKCKSDKPEIIEGIQNSGKLDDDNEKLLVEIITQLKGTFNS